MSLSNRTLALTEQFADARRGLSVPEDEWIPGLVAVIFKTARLHRATDIHLVPEHDRWTMHWRIDGVLHLIAGFDAEEARRIVARLKVLASLLTYRTDLPQEGRIRDSGDDGEIRVTTFPTMFGERTTLRLFAAASHLEYPQDLNLPPDIETSLLRMSEATSGVILVCGPSGSGKTTTAYAVLREISRRSDGALSLMSLEDPIEVMLPGVSQAQVNQAVDFDLAHGLRAMMRQDPDVILIGEIRDAATAEAAFQAALTGHLVVTTFHAGSSSEAVTRLLDMGIEPYLLRSTLQSVVCQRLLRAACRKCSQPRDGRGSADESSIPGASSDKNSESTAHGHQCPECGGIGYSGRFVIAELLDVSLPKIGAAVLQSADSHHLQTVAKEDGIATLKERAEQSVAAGRTHPEEVFRILGRDSQT